MVVKDSLVFNSFSEGGGRDNVFIVEVQRVCLHTSFLKLNFNL